MSVAKIIELVGNSDVGWQEAVANAVAEANDTLDGISGVEVTNMTASVENGRITNYKATVKLAFRLRDSR
jgi:flavin-binding protein dodecin